MKLEELREKIDEIDRDIIGLLRKRFEIVGDIARLKGDLQLKVEDDQRERDIIENCKRAAKGLDEEFVEELMRLILSQSKKIQEEKK
jgi:chorismate mutase